MAIMQLTIIPLGTQTPGVGQYVAEIGQALQQEGVPHTLTDMGTIIEGEPQALLALAARLHARTLVITLERPASELVEMLPPLVSGTIRFLLHHFHDNRVT